MKNRRKGEGALGSYITGRKQTVLRTEGKEEKTVTSPC